MKAFLSLALLGCSILSTGQPKFTYNEFAYYFPDHIVISNGKIPLFRTHTIEDPEETDSFLGDLLLNVLDDEHKYRYFVFTDGFVEEPVMSGKKLKKQIKRWFRDDPQLIKISTQKYMDARHLPWLVLFYNGHAPRYFDSTYTALPHQFEMDAFTDDRDGQLYDVFTTGTQQWLAENLRYEGCQGCVWKRDPGNGNVYYSWDVATRVCPAGWNLPTVVDWKLLFYSLGMPIDKLNESGGLGKGSQWPRELLYQYNSTGFNARPAGFLTKKGELTEPGAIVFWSFELSYSESADGVTLTEKQAEFSYYQKEKMMNVRCVRPLMR